MADKRKNKIEELLAAEEPVVEAKAEGEKGREGAFNPKFNVREEFPLWVAEQFPGLKKHAKKGTAYSELEARRGEVYEAALGALTHGDGSTKDCASSKLYGGWSEFERGFGKTGRPEDRPKSLIGLVRALKDLSISLGGDSHYTECGVFTGGKSWKGWSSERFEAFVYRAGEQNGKETTYFMTKERQDFGDKENPPVLIGELDELSKWALEDLERAIPKFKGPEKTFVDKMDSIAYRTGGYQSSYGRNYVGAYGDRRSWGIGGLKTEGGENKKGVISDLFGLGGDYGK